MILIHEFFQSRLDQWLFVGNHFGHEDDGIQQDLLGPGFERGDALVLVNSFSSAVTDGYEANLHRIVFISHADVFPNFLTIPKARGTIRGTRAVAGILRVRHVFHEPVFSAVRGPHRAAAARVVRKRQHR